MISSAGRYRWPIPLTALGTARSTSKPVWFKTVQVSACPTRRDASSTFSSSRDNDIGGACHPSLPTGGRQFLAAVGDSALLLGQVSRDATVSVQLTIVLTYASIDHNQDHDNETLREYHEKFAETLQFLGISLTPSFIKLVIIMAENKGDHHRWVKPSGNGWLFLW